MKGTRERMKEREIHFSDRRKQYEGKNGVRRNKKEQSEKGKKESLYKEHMKEETRKNGKNERKRKASFFG